MSHEMTVRVRGYHCDYYGHVNNARYLELLEEARWRWAESVMDLPAWQAAGFGFVVAGIDIRYRRPAPAGMLLLVRSDILRLGAKVGVFRQEVLEAEGGRLLAEADVTFAVIDTRTGRALPLEGRADEPFTAWRREHGEPAAG
jgi:thioesterase-3